jgi:PLP dependent protein
MSIIERYNSILKDVEKVSSASGRDINNIQIIAVSKTFPVEAVQQAINEGLTLFGENKVQEAKQKIRELRGTFSVHFIGHLQSNKASEAVRLFDVIHSIDKLSTAEKLDLEAQKIEKIQKILIQVNTSAEDTKSGISPEETIPLVKGILNLKNIDIIGLMTIGPLTDDESSIRNSFRMLKSLLSETNKTLGTEMKELSMGMSSDYRIAIEEGATLLRIGSAIFGQRDYIT